MPNPDPMGAAKGITATHPSASSFFTQHHVVGAIGQYLKSILNEQFGRFQRRLVVGEQGFFVADDFHLDEIAKARFSGQLTGHDRFLDGIATGGVR